MKRSETNNIMYEADNRFLDSVGRFPKIEKDDPPLYLFAGDYPNYWGKV